MSYNVLNVFAHLLVSFPVGALSAVHGKLLARSQLRTCFNATGFPVVRLTDAMGRVQQETQQGQEGKANGHLGKRLVTGVTRSGFVVRGGA